MPLSKEYKRSFPGSVDVHQTTKYKHDCCKPTW